MRLDRNIKPGRAGKYALIKMREISQGKWMEILSKDGTAKIPVSLIDFGTTPSKSFFVIKGSDRFAAAALKAYRDQVLSELFELELARNARAVNEPWMTEQMQSLREYAKDLTDLLAEWGRLETKLPD
jgi:hypothetical protein